MTISTGNLILIIVMLIAGGVMIWQYINLSPSQSSDEDWIDTVDDSEEKLDETEEMLRRMERLSKRENDDKQSKK